MSACQDTDADSELLAHFIAEAGKLIERLDDELDGLEPAPEDEARLNAVFRTFHSVKGAAGFLQLDAVVEICHRAEDELNLARIGKRPRNAALVAHARRAAESLKHAFMQIGGAAPADDARVADTTMRLAAPHGHGEDLRIPPARVDAVTSAAGDVTRARKRLLELAGRIDDIELHGLLNRLDAAALELQAAVTQLRRLPLINVFGRFNRVVRALAMRLGKEVDVELHGVELELDKSLIESLVAPLVHLVRNAVDHGIEAPAARAAAGKPSVGRLTLSAFIDGDAIVIGVEDDGAGVSVDAVRHTALARQHVDPSTLAAMSDRDALQLVFVPGLSTRAEVSDVSGRGVGLEVVKSEVARLNGRVELESVPGRGSRVLIRLPAWHAAVAGLDPLWNEPPGVGVAEGAGRVGTPLEAGRSR